MKTTQITIALALACGLQLYTLIQVDSALRQLRQLQSLPPAVDSQRLSQPGLNGFSVGAIRSSPLDGIKQHKSVRM